jgi:glycosyl transferase, family 25
MEMRVFLINLDRDTERLASMRQRARRAELTLERISAILGSDVPQHMRAQFAHSPLLPGEIGCYASHLLASAEILKRNIPYAAVVEDDVGIEPDATAALAELVTALPPRWDIVKLCNRRPVRAVLCLQHLQSGRMLVRYTRHPILAGAYLISATGAAKLTAPRPRTLPIDIDFFHPWRMGLETYGVAPAIFPQSHNEFRSNIGQANSRTMPRLTTSSIGSERLASLICCCALLPICSKRQN